MGDQAQEISSSDWHPSSTTTGILHMQFIGVPPATSSAGARGEEKDEGPGEEALLTAPPL